MYALIENDNVIAFPYTGKMLREAHPNTLFPKGFDDELLSQFGVERVHIIETKYNPMVETVVIVTPPRYDGDRWVVDQTIEPLPETEAAANVRSKRNQLLLDSDWTQTADSPVDSAAWAAYRSALRDITENPAFPWLDETDWPYPPT